MRSLRRVDSSREWTAFVLAEALSCGRCRQVASSKPPPSQIPDGREWLVGAFSISQIQCLAKAPPLSRDLGNLKIASVSANQSKMNLRGLIKYVLFRDTT